MNNVSEMPSSAGRCVYSRDFRHVVAWLSDFQSRAPYGISRLYETFGNTGATPSNATLSPEEYSRTWYRQNPPLPKVNGLSEHNTYQETGC